MSLQIDGVWKGAVWAATPWAAGVWREGVPAPSFTGTIPSITKTQNTGTYQFDLSSYFTGATSYSIAPALETGWSFNTSTAVLEIDTDAIGSFGPFVVTATNIAGTADSNGFGVAVVAASQGAGSANRRYRNIYRIKVDGEPFEFSTYDAAIAFLDRAKKAAAELADRTLLEAIESHRQEPVEIPLPTFKDPVIVASSRDLRSAVSETKKEIAAIYKKAARDAEIAMLLEVVSRDQFNEEIIWFM